MHTAQNAPPLTPPTHPTTTHEFIGAYFQCDQIWRNFAILATFYCCWRIKKDGIRQ